MRNLCTKAALFLLLLLPALANATVSVTVTGTNVTCYNAHNGTATAVGSGGWAPYTYHWSTGATTATITGLAPGDYSVTVTDIDQGFAIGQITITQPTALGVTAYGSSQICGIVPDGTSTAVPYGGTPPYIYHWSNGGTTAQIIHLAAGIYTVTVTDANSCTAAAQDTIYFWNEGVWIMDSTVNVSCFGQNNGSSHVAGMSGTPPYMYTWSTGATTQTVTGLAPGNYTVTVKDANGCSNTHLVTVTQPPILTLTATTTPGVCGLSGSATISASGGTGPYTIHWSNNSGNATITVGAGTYTVTVTDSHNCASSATATVTVAPNTLLIHANVVSKAGCSVGGSAIATVSGGTGPYSYSWSIGQTTATASNLPANTYTVTVVDITTGCTGTATVSVPNEPTVTLTATLVTNATCALGGSATANVAGGTPPYTYKWDNLQTGQTATNLIAGQHSVTVMDALGCIATAAVTIGQTQGPSVTAQALTSATCLTGGSATVTATGGSGGYLYIWNTGATTKTITNAPAGTYHVTVTDAGGCSAAATVSITQTGFPSAVIASSTNTGCSVNTGSATAGASLGTPPFTYKWSNNAVGQTVTGLGPGVYTVTVTDAAGCTATTQVSIASSLPPNVVISASSNAKCDQPGSATVNASNGTGPYHYLWSDAEITATAVNFVNAGTYTVTVTDALGCTATASVNIGFTGNGVRIGDYVWYDDDQNGFQEPLETGVPGVTVMLKKAGPDGIFGTADDIVVSATTTNANGLYEFDCVTPGTYILMFSGIPAGYQFTGKDQVPNDCKDSDANAAGKTDAFTITSGQADNFCFDAGIHIKCDNVTNAGTICCDQTICEGTTPALLYASLPPVGGSGAIQYQWLQLVQMGQAPPLWVAIPGATNETYQPGALYETSYFMRCAKRAGCVTFVESNIVKITVNAPGSPNCGNFINTFLLAPTNNGMVLINWTTIPEPKQYMYSVEHSGDGKAWDVITTVMGKGNPNGTNDYTYTDETPINGMNFYRIKRSGANNPDAFSEIKSIDISMTVNESMTIRPNPVIDNLHIHNAMKYDNDVVVTLLDTNGKTLDVVTIPSGTNQQLNLPMTNLPQGIYLVRVNFGNGQLKTLKITKY